MSRKWLAASKGRLHDRIQRLADPSRPSRARRLAFALAIATGIGFAGFAIVSAIRYHATYVEEIAHGR
jgi:hypothetical protein